MGEVDPENVVEPEMKAGDAFLFENWTYHSIGLNHASYTRKVIMTGYAYSWVKPLDHDVLPKEVIAEVQDDIGRQLVDGLRTAGTRIDNRPLQEWCERYGVRRSADIEFEKRLRRAG